MTSSDSERVFCEPHFRVVFIAIASLYHLGVFPDTTLTTLFITNSPTTFHRRVVGSTDGIMAQLCDLSNELLLNIFGRLNVQDLRRSATVCRSLQGAVEDSLYHTFQTRTNNTNTIRLFLRTITRRPELAKLVRRVELGATDSDPIVMSSDNFLRMRWDPANNLEDAEDYGNFTRQIESAGVPDVTKFLRDDQERIRNYLRHLSTNGQSHSSHDLGFKPNMPSRTLPWHAALYDGAHDAFIALLLSLVENIEQLCMDLVPDDDDSRRGCYTTMVCKAALDPSLSPRQQFLRLRLVRVRGLGDRQHFFSCIFACLPSVTSFEGIIVDVVADRIISDIRSIDRIHPSNDYDIPVLPCCNATSLSLYCIDNGLREAVEALECCTKLNTLKLWDIFRRDTNGEVAQLYQVLANLGSTLRTLELVEVGPVLYHRSARNQEMSLLSQMPNLRSLTTDEMYEHRVWGISEGEKIQFAANLYSPCLEELNFIASEYGEPRADYEGDVHALLKEAADLLGYVYMREGRKTNVVRLFDCDGEPEMEFDTNRRGWREKFTVHQWGATLRISVRTRQGVDENIQEILGW